LRAEAHLFAGRVLGVAALFYVLLKEESKLKAAHEG